MTGVQTCALPISSPSPSPPSSEPAKAVTTTAPAEKAAPSPADLAKLSYAKLQAVAKKYHVKAKGTKPVLLAAVQKVLMPAARLLVGESNYSLPVLERHRMLSKDQFQTWHNANRINCKLDANFETSWDNYKVRYGK